MSGWEEEVRRYVASGRVQGVGYRAFAARVAHTLGLRGGATNLPDGRVEVIARGPGHAHERLEAALREGPRFARVDAVEVEPVGTEPPGSASWDVEF
jgi:acylphosphatase